MSHGPNLLAPEADRDMVACRLAPVELNFILLEQHQRRAVVY